MAKYLVHYYVDIEYEVEADNEDGALMKADYQFGNYVPDYDIELIEEGEK